MILLALLLLVGSTKPVSRVEYIGSEDEWRGSRYFRPDDPPGYPRMVVIAKDGTACVVTEYVRVEPQEGSSFNCATPWRHGR